MGFPCFSGRLTRRCIVFYHTIVERGRRDGRFVDFAAKGPYNGPFTVMSGECGMRLFYDIIGDKRDGRELSAADISRFLTGYLHEELTDYQMSALLMAVCIRGLTPAELSVWAATMLNSGEVLSFSDDGRPVVDKHSTGGVGDKISLPLAPLLAALGFRVPMISGRGLGHTGGTLDKLEAIPGFRVGLDLVAFKQQVQELGVAMIGQTAEIAPLDRRLYALRDVTGTVESVPLIASSIMSKKLAEGIDGLLLDVKTGDGAFMRERHDAKKLAVTMKDIGERAGKKMVVLITDMSEPLGRSAGHALEIIESIAVLRGERIPQVTELTERQAAELLLAFGMVKSRAAGVTLARGKLSDGTALAIFRRMVERQGGDPRIVDDPTLLPTAPYTFDVMADRDGILARIGARAAGKALVLLGGGRIRKEDSIDPGVGMTFPKKVGDPVVKGESLIRIHYRDRSRLAAALELLADEVTVSAGPVDPPKLVTGRL